MSNIGKSDNKYTLDQGYPLMIDRNVLNGARIKPLIKVVNSLKSQARGCDERQIADAMLVSCEILQNDIQKLIYFKDQCEKVEKLLKAIGFDIPDSNGNVMLYESVEFLKDQYMKARKS